MINIKVSVTPFTKKIIEKDFGSLIKVNKRHLLFPLFNSKNSFSRSENETEFLNFTIHKSMIKTMNPSLALHRFCKNKMLDFVFAQTLIKPGAMQSLRNFYLLYGIDENDFPLESAYKSLQRFMKRKNKINESKNNGDIVLDFYTLWTIEELEKLLANFTLKYFKNHISRRKDFKTILIRQSRVYIYRNIGTLSVNEISKLLGISQINIYKYLSRYHNKVIKNKVFPFPETSDFDQQGTY